jgi:hypothetical protein
MLTRRSLFALPIVAVPSHVPHANTLAADWGAALRDYEASHGASFVADSTATQVRLPRSDSYQASKYSYG